MSYIALYRKYRPASFDEVIGQNDTITILKNSIINKTFTHAYLFSGAKGTGKTSVARILAKAINCQENINGEACNKCSNCQFINDSKNEIDIIEIDGASNNGVEEIRNIRNNINLLPMNLKYKIYIIDEVHMLTTSAFNALLKTLEEPPKHIVFIFATTEPYKIPETIISRCQWFQFEKIKQDDLIKVFETILTNESIKFELEALIELALLCQGSLRDGINSLEKMINYTNSVTLESVKKLYEIISIDQKVQLLKAIFSQDFNQIIMLINQFNNYLSDFKKFLVSLIYLIQDIVIYRLTKNITISKYLKLEMINLFNIVTNKDLKLLLSLFESLIILEFDDENLKALLINRILKSFDKLEKYHFINENFDLSKNNDLVKNDLKSLPSKDKNIKETKIIQEKQIKKQEIKLDEELLFNVLNVIIQAQVEIRKEVKANWLKIPQLIESNKFRSFSKIYLNTSIKAASLNAIIIVCDNIIQADLINQSFFYQEHRIFLNFVLKKEYMVYALDKWQWQLIGQKYQALKKENNLPQPKPIIIFEPTIKQKEERKSQTLAFLQNIFSEVEEI